MAAQEHLVSYYADLGKRRGVQAVRNSGRREIKYAEASSPAHLPPGDGYPCMRPIIKGKIERLDPAVVPRLKDLGVAKVHEAQGRSGDVLVITITAESHGRQVWGIAGGILPRVPCYRTGRLAECFVYLLAII